MSSPLRADPGCASGTGNGGGSPPLAREHPGCPPPPTVPEAARKPIPKRSRLISYWPVDVAGPAAPAFAGNHTHGGLRRRRIDSGRWVIVKWRPIITTGLICAAAAGIALWVIHAGLVGH